MGFLQKATNYLEERLELPTIWRSFTDRRLPKGIGWLHTFGSATLFLILVQTVTGIFLAFYYVPSPEHAYLAVSQITNQLQFGWLVRGIHKWAASLVIVFVALHLVRVLYTGAYKYPRELTWVVGVLLLLVVMAFGFTGYLLPWDQKGYWATVVGTHIAGYAPIVGKYTTELLRGQPDVGVRTLGRFYAFHTLFLPVILFTLVAIHLAMVIKQGIASPPTGEFASVTREQYRTLTRASKERGRPFYESMAKDTLVAFVLLLVLLFLAWKLGAPLDKPADPASATYLPRPEWYFFFLFELLWWFPNRWIPVATFWIPAALVIALLALPWLDRSIHRAPLRRPWTSGIATATIVMAAFLTYKGATAPIPATVAAATRAAQDTQALPLLAQRGRQVFEEQGCAACHTVRGAGGAGGPDLTTVGQRRNAAWLTAFIPNPSATNAASEMPPYDSISKEDLDSLVAYLQTLK
jgi:quinol-cytochrome oxidoreductase complex cytochrome b subunit